MTEQSDGLRFPAPVDEPLAITHVTVVPMDADRFIPDQTIIFQGGKITALDRASDVPLDGARVVDGRGKFVMPGLADMHVHYWDATEFGLFLANGVTQVRNMWGAPFHLALQRKIAEGAFPGPRVVTTSPIIDGPGPNGTTIWPNSAMAASPEQAEALVQEFAARGYQQTKVYSWLKLDVLRALGRASRGAGVRMVGHCPDGITYEQAVDAGMTCFEHLTGIAEGRMGGKSLLGLRAGSMEALRTVTENLDLDSIRRLAHDLAEHDIWNCPTLIVWQGMSRDETEAMADPLLAYEPATLTESWNPANDFRLKATTESRAEWLALAHKRIDLYRRVISILHEEGAPLLLGTDTPNPFVFQGFAIHNEIANLISSGLSPYEALRAGTSEAARFLGEESEWGTVARGKRADLLLLDSNPLTDVAALQHPHAVFVNGYPFFRDDLDALLAQRATSVTAGVEAVTLHLPAVVPDVETVADGELVDRIAGSEDGRLRFRHARRPDSSWLIEEVVRRGPNSLHSTGGTTTARLELSPSFHLLRATIRTDSFVGREGCDVQLGEDELYTIRYTDIDGVETVSRLPGPLLPSEDLSLTALLLILAAQEVDRAAGALGIDRGQGVEIPLRLVRRESGLSWQVSIERFGTSTEQTFQIAPDGTLLSMGEQTWRGLREVLPTQTTTPEPMAPGQ